MMEASNGPMSASEHMAWHEATKHAGKPVPEAITKMRLKAVRTTNTDIVATFEVDLANQDEFHSVVGFPAPGEDKWFAIAPLK